MQPSYLLALVRSCSAPGKKVRWPRAMGRAVRPSDHVRPSVPKLFSGICPAVPSSARRSNNDWDGSGVAN